MKKTISIIIATILMVFTINISNAQTGFYVDTVNSISYNMPSSGNGGVSFFEYGDSLYWQFGDSVIIFNTNFDTIGKYYGFDNNDRKQHYQKYGNNYIGYNADTINSLSTIYTSFNDTTITTPYRWSYNSTTNIINSHNIILGANNLHINDNGKLYLNDTLKDSITVNSSLITSQFSHSGHSNYLAWLNDTTAYYCHGQSDTMNNDYIEIYIIQYHTNNNSISHYNFLTQIIPSVNVIVSAWISSDMHTIVLTTINSGDTYLYGQLLIHNKCSLIILHDSAYMSTTGIIENIKNTNVLNINLYPNPATDTINILYTSNDNTSTVTIFNILGDIMFTNKQTNQPDENTLSLDISNFAPGVYFVTIDGVSTKFIKQ